MRRRPGLLRASALSLSLLSLAVLAPAAPPERSAAAPPAAAPAAGSEVTEAELRRLLADCRAAVERRPTQDAELARLARALRPIRRVRRDDGRRVLEVNLRRDADILQSLVGTNTRTGAPADVRARFAALEKVVRRPGPAASPDPVLQAREILKEKQFARDPELETPGADLPWMEKVRKWVTDMFDRMLKGIGRFLRWLFGRWRFNPSAPRWQGVGDVVLLVLYFLAAVAASVALYWLGRMGWTSYLRKTGRLKEDPGGPTGLDLTEEGITDPLASARDQADRGDYRSAIRLAYIASLRRLEGSGMLVLEKNRTNWEYQRALRAKDGAAYDRMLPATRLFDRVWYGRRPGTRDEYESVLRVHDALPDTPPPSAAESPDESPAAADARQRGNDW